MLSFTDYFILLSNSNSALGITADIQQIVGHQSVRFTFWILLEQKVFEFLYDHTVMCSPGGNNRWRLQISGGSRNATKKERKRIQQHVNISSSVRERGRRSCRFKKVDRGRTGGPAVHGQVVTHLLSLIGRLRPGDAVDQG